MRFQSAIRAAQFFGLSLLSAGLANVVTPTVSVAQVCNPFGCSAPSAGPCNPFGCPNPGAAPCTPFGCPEGNSGFNGNNTSGNSPNIDLNSVLRGIFGNSNNSPNNSSNNDNSRSSRRSSRSGVDRLLSSQGLIRTDCTPGVVEVWLSLEDSVCAVPTAQYPTGRYYFDERGFTITPVGGANTATQPAPTAQPPYGYAPQPSTPTPQLPYGYAPQPSAPTAQPPYGYPPQPSTPTVQPPYVYAPQSSISQPTSLQPVSPAILMVGNPSQPVPADISAQISASLVGRGLSPVSCSLNPGVTVLVGQYMACTYPTPSYPAGRYTLRQN